MRDQAPSALARETPWKLLIGDRQLDGVLGDAGKLRFGARGGMASIPLGDDGRLVLTWTKRSLSFELAWTGAPFLIAGLGSPSEGGGLPTRLIGIGLGDAQFLHDVPLRVRTTRRAIVVRGSAKGAGTRWGAITILSPDDGATLAADPVDLTIRFDGAADPTAMRVLLDGVDVTAQFETVDGMTHHTTVRRPALNLGRNQLQVTSGPHRATAEFFLSYSGLGDDPSTLPLLVPIKTRVLTGPGTQASDYNVALYLDPDDPDMPTRVQANATQYGTSDGLQLVFIRRSDLKVLSNASYGFLEDVDFDVFEAAFTSPPAECGSTGCLAVVQSLVSIGDMRCASGGPLDPACQGFIEFLRQIGASGRLAFANGENPQIAFSFVGNVSVPFDGVSAGTFFERLTCRGSNYGDTEPVCDFLGFPNTSFSAPAGATPDQIGNLDGVLVRDNFGAFTYAPAGRPVSFSTATTSQPLGHTITVDGTAYATDALNGAPGGIHLLILDRTTLAPVANQTFPATADAGHAQALFDAVTGYKSYPFLFIVSAFGDSGYQGASRGTWFSTSQLIRQIGGTQQVFYLTNPPEDASPPQDDYTLVGFFVDDFPSGVATGLEGQVGAELGSVIARETERYPLDSDMEGLLTIDHQGYYSPGPTGHALGLATVETSEILSASRLGHTPWPFPGPDPAKSMAAYTWISQQLCCTDIRAAYVNLNVSPIVWLTQLAQLSYDAAKVPDSSQADFDAMAAQLATEFQYVAVVRQFQANVRELHEAQQANVGLLLQQATTEVVDNLNVAFTTAATPISWLKILNQVFGILGTASNLLTITGPEGGGAGAAIRFATGLGSMIADDAVRNTNNPAGTPLKALENEGTTAANLAARAADDFASTLASLGNSFDRIVTDWGRLKTVGAPLLANHLPWDENAAGLLLSTYNRLVRRELYATLLKANGSVNVYPYVSDSRVLGQTFYGSGDLCDWPSDVAGHPQVLFYPSGAPNTDGNDPHGTAYPFDYQWGIWALTFNDFAGTSCPSNHTNPYPDTFGLFAPLDPGNPQALGVYRLWFYTREGYPTRQVTDNIPCYEGSC